MGSQHWRHLGSRSTSRTARDSKNVQGVDATSIHVTDAPNAGGQIMKNIQHAGRHLGLKGMMMMKMMMMMMMMTKLGI